MAEQFYTVKAGDSLSLIAKELWGDARRWPEIFEANRDQIQNPNLIKVGQKLRIPCAAPEPAPPAQAPAAEQPPAPTPPAAPLQSAEPWTYVPPVKAEPPAAEETKQEEPHIPKGKQAHQE